MEGYFVLNREMILRNLQELQADFEDLTDEDIIECRECILNRINLCLVAIGESEGDNEC